MFGSLGFAGGGRATYFMLDGLRRAGALPREVAVADPAEKALARIREAFPDIGLESEPEAVLDKDLLVLSLHPPALSEFLTGAVGRLKPEAAVLSLAPKVTLAQLEERLGGARPIARCIPNAPSLVGKGYNPVSFPASLSEPGRTAFLSFLGPLGEAPQVPENHLEAYAILSAMGPTYFWFQFKALRDLGVKFGLPPSDAERAVTAMTLGALDVLWSSGMAPDEVMDLVAFRPLEEVRGQVEGWYEQRLVPLFHKLRGEAVP